MRRAAHFAKVGNLDNRRQESDDLITYQGVEFS